MNGNVTVFLLIEDDPHDVLLVQHEFDNLPYAVQLHVVNDGTQAINYLVGKADFADRQKHPLPHVILLDLKMPKMNGFEVLEWLRSKSPGNLHLIPVIVMSSSSLPQDVARAYELGANAYMTKAIDWTEFHERINALGLYWSKHVDTPPVS